MEFSEGWEREGENENMREYVLARGYQKRERGEKGLKKSSFQKKYVYLVDYKLCTGKAYVLLLTLFLVIIPCSIRV